MREETHFLRAVRCEKSLFLSGFKKLLELLAAVVSDKGALVQMLVPANYC